MPKHLRYYLILKYQFQETNIQKNISNRFLKKLINSPKYLHVKISFEKKEQRNRESHKALIPLKKAYDSVPSRQVWEEMQNLELRPMCVHTKTKMKFGNLLA